MIPQLSFSKLSMFAIDGDNKIINKMDISKDELFDAQRCVLDNNQS